MTDRRMFSRSVVCTDSFLDMPHSAQALYLQLCMAADDDGFVDNPKTIMRQTAVTDDSMKMLIAKQYVLMFDTGVIVVRHWKQSNRIAKDRYKASIHIAEKSMLSVDGSETYCIQTVPSSDTNCIQTVYKPDTECTEPAPELYTDCIQTVPSSSTQYSIVQYSEVQNSKVKNNTLSVFSASEPETPAKKPQHETVPDWFEGIWKQYPAKRGKGDIKKTHYAELAKAGEERVQRALDNYLAELRRNEWQHPMHGSRFFKGAWKDYDREPEQPQHEPTMQEIIEQMRRESEQSGN